jgi:GTP cyclohydrolase I
MHHETPQPEAIGAYDDMLHTMGLDRFTDTRTSTRYTTALHQMTYGVNLDPTRHLQITFPPVTTSPCLVTVTNVPFASLCSHHMLPFWGTATIAYLPQQEAKIVGLSKLARCFREYAARPQMQEQLGQQVIDAISENLQSDGAAVAIHGTHACMALRGAGTGVGTAMITTAFTGLLDIDPWRTQFLTSATSVINPH